MDDNSSVLSAASTSLADVLSRLEELEGQRTKDRNRADRSEILKEAAFLNKRLSLLVEDEINRITVEAVKDGLKHKPDSADKDDAAKQQLDRILADLKEDISVGSDASSVQSGVSSARSELSDAISEAIDRAQNGGQPDGSQVVASQADSVVLKFFNETVKHTISYAMKTMAKPDDISSTLEHARLDKLVDQMQAPTISQMFQGDGVQDLFQQGLQPLGGGSRAYVVDDEARDCREAIARWKKHKRMAAAGHYRNIYQSSSDDEDSIMNMSRSSRCDQSVASSVASDNSDEKTVRLTKQVVSDDCSVVSLDSHDSNLNRQFHMFEI